MTKESNIGKESNWPPQNFCLQNVSGPVIIHRVFTPQIHSISAYMSSPLHIPHDLHLHARLQQFCFFSVLYQSSFFRVQLVEEV